MKILDEEMETLGEECTVDMDDIANRNNEHHYIEDRNTIIHRRLYARMGRGRLTTNSAKRVIAKRFMQQMKGNLLQRLRNRHTEEELATRLVETKVARSPREARKMVPLLVVETYPVETDSTWPCYGFREIPRKDGETRYKIYKEAL
tara:strand:+ start:229 stop:669 length:441 start_codon:yes stop_codon:yes gene_type:complete